MRTRVLAHMRIRISMGMFMRIRMLMGMLVVVCILTRVRRVMRVRTPIRTPIRTPMRIIFLKFNEKVLTTE